MLSREGYASNLEEDQYAIEGSITPNLINASEQAIKSVVHINSRYVSNETYAYYDPFYGNRFFNQPKENIASGSGVIISDDGYIITNKHVTTKIIFNTEFSSLIGGSVFHRKSTKT